MFGELLEIQIVIAVVLTAIILIGTGKMLTQSRPVRRIPVLAVSMTLTEVAVMLAAFLYIPVLGYTWRVPQEAVKSMIVLVIYMEVFGVLMLIDGVSGYLAARAQREQ